LRDANPDLLMVSMPAFPAGPWEQGRAYGYTLEEAAGIPGIAGEEGMPPMMSHYAYGDAIGGLNGTAALLLGLLHKKATGQGQHIELSQVQCMLPMIAPWFIAHDVTGQVPPRLGNRHPVYVPQNCFPCAGDDAWVMVSVTDDAMWQHLCRAIGRADLAGDPTLATATGRAAHIESIEAAIGGWTQHRTADDAMMALQAAQVAAGVVRSPFALGSEPQLVARGYWQPVDRPWVGRHNQPSAPYRENGVPYPVRHAAPTLGEFNEAVLGGILGLSGAELAALTAAAVIGTEGLPPSAQSRHAGAGAGETQA
jgi:crotonobetainyl-CoA:carnitine CoA-transferase CaiB-like acyl-CoA transferase